MGWPDRRFGLPIALILATAALVSGCGSGSDGEGTEPAGEPEPRGPALGYSEVFRPGGFDPALLAASGAEIARRPLNWTTVAPERGRRDWSLYDGIAADLSQAGVRPLWVVTSAPCWAAAVADCDPATPSYAPDPVNHGDYAEFVVEVAERYPNSAGIEIWNEPNLERFNIGGRGPEDYADLVLRTGDAAARAGVEVPLVLAGLAPTGRSDRGGTEWTGYQRAVLGAGAGDAVDAIGIHPYAPFDPVRGIVPAAEELIDQAEELAAEAGVEAPLWITEVGSSTAGARPASPERQARELAGTFELAERREIPVLIIHRFFDQEDPRFDIERGYGVIEADRRSPKPAYCELARLSGLSASECGPGGAS